MDREMIPSGYPLFRFVRAYLPSSREQARANLTYSQVAFIQTSQFRQGLVKSSVLSVPCELATYSPVAVVIFNNTEEIYYWFSRLLNVTQYNFVVQTNHTVIAFTAAITILHLIVVFGNEKRTISLLIASHCPGFC